MTYVYDPEITPWFSMLSCRPFADFHELRVMREAAVQDGLQRYEPDIAIRTRDLTIPGPDGERDGLLPGLLYTHGLRLDLGV